MVGYPCRTSAGTPEEVSPAELSTATAHSTGAISNVLRELAGRRDDRDEQSSSPLLCSPFLSTPCVMKLDGLFDGRASTERAVVDEATQPGGERLGAALRPGA
ncbi:MAG: hypothetical protein JWO62_1554 [Acidimicrobiaceae bacterium]|nr:hypothetical protein [Acidimicrobiaceae bacterium]